MVLETLADGVGMTEYVAGKEGWEGLVDSKVRWVGMASPKAQLGGKLEVWVLLVGWVGRMELEVWIARDIWGVVMDSLRQAPWEAWEHLG